MSELFYFIFIFFSYFLPLFDHRNRGVINIAMYEMGYNILTVFHHFHPCFHNAAITIGWEVTGGEA